MSLRSQHSSNQSGSDFSLIPTHRSSKIRDLKCASELGLCNGFLAGLAEAASNSSRRTFFWVFEDEAPEYPQLTRSAELGCSWCRWLKVGVKSATRGEHRDWLENTLPEKGIGRVRLTAWTNSGYSGPLADIKRITVKSDGYKFIGTYTLEAYEMFISNTDEFDALSNVSLENIQSRITTCVETHASCPTFKDESAPSRLINISSGNSIRLENTNGQSRRYAALSYCWGASPALQSSKTTLKNLNSRLTGFDLSELPATLRQCIEVAQRLNFNHVWIDAICIVQDSETDWKAEAQKMMDYYGNAYLTIVPILADSADSEFTFKKDSEAVLRIPERNMVLTSEGSPRYDSPLLRTSFTKWSTRGWTLQEKLNSSRILFVSGPNSELACRQGCYDTLEGWRDYDSPDKVQSFLPLHDARRDQEVLSQYHKRYETAVWQYTGRTLTNPADRWVAFSGIAERLTLLTGQKNVGGLWENHIISQLMWILDYRSKHLHAKVDTDFPSWSWIGSNWCIDKSLAGPYDLGPFVALPSFNNIEKPHATLENIIYEESTTALQLSGALLREPLFGDTDEVPYGIHYNSPLFLDYEIGPERLGGSDIVGFPIGLGPHKGIKSAWKFLILQLVKPKSLDGSLPRYRRVGLFITPSDSAEKRFKDFLRDFEQRPQESILLV